MKLKTKDKNYKEIKKIEDYYSINIETNIKK